MLMMVVKKKPSQMDVAPWCYKWDGTGWDRCLGGVRYRAPYGANDKYICSV